MSALDFDGVRRRGDEPEPERDDDEPAEDEELAPVRLGSGAWFVETPKDFRGVRWI